MIPSDTYRRILIVIERLREGDTLKAACETAGIARPTLRTHLAQDASLQALFNEALDDFYDVMADTLVNIDQAPGCSDPKMAAVISKNMMWFLSRKRPDRYGDRMIIENVGGVDREIVEMMRAAVERIPIPAPTAPALPPMIDVTPRDETREAAILAELLG